MMEEMDHGADVVFGQRRRRSGETPFKNASAALFYRALRRLVDIDIPADAGDFRLISRRAIDILNGMPERFRFIRGMVSWIGLRQVPIVYDRDPRYAGTTGYSATKMIRFALDAITSFSIVPLRLASICGCITALCGVLMLGYTVGSWLFNVVVPGWTSLTTMYRFNAFARGLTRACVKKPVYRLPSNASQPTTEEIGPLAIFAWCDRRRFSRRARSKTSR